MKAIVALGGAGDMAKGDTALIDEEIVQLTGKARPRALFIPTASEDSAETCDAFRVVYENLGCDCLDLKLLAEDPSDREISSKIGGADLIYVAGGNTLKMMKVWRRKGVDRLLRKAHEKGTVLSGVSAGAICWFEYGHSDSARYFKNPQDRYIRVSGLGLVKGTFCPHYLGGRRPDFLRMMERKGGVGYGVADLAAIVVEEGGIRSLSNASWAKATKVQRKSGKVLEEDI